MVVSPSFLFHQSLNFWLNAGYRALLRPIANRTGKIRKHDILLVAAIDHGPAYLGHFLDHHRKLGVEHFLLIDLGKGNSVSDAVQKHEDVSLWQARFSAIAPGRIFRAKNALLQRYAHGHLCVLVDTDELLVYPRMETRNLRDLGDFLRNERRIGLNAIAIDCYDAAPLGSDAYGRIGHPLELCPYADRDFYFEKPIGDDISEVRGGISTRLLGAPQPRQQTLLNRIPIVWWKWTHRLTRSDFGMVPLKGMRIQDWKNPVISGAVLRFPFLQAAYKDASAHRRSLRLRYGKGYERMLAREMAVFDDNSSFRFESSRQLVEMGLISSGNWF